MNPKEIATQLREIKKAIQASDERIDELLKTIETFAASARWLMKVQEFQNRKKPPQEKLIDFMQLKSDLLQLKNPEAPPLFVEADKENMKTWAYGKSEAIVEHLLKGPGDHDIQNCPACIYHVDCGDCSYARVHGPCDKKESAYFIIAETENGSATDQLTPEGINLLRKTLID